MIKQILFTVALLGLLSCEHQDVEDEYEPTYEAGQLLVKLYS